MLKPVRSALRAAIEGGVEFVAAYNRKRLPRIDNPFLVGIHAPMRSELTLQDFTVAGSIPVGLDGRYLKMVADRSSSLSPSARCVIQFIVNAESGGS